jgi:hypothetical protein
VQLLAEVLWHLQVLALSTAMLLLCDQAVDLRYAICSNYSTMVARACALQATGEVAGYEVQQHCPCAATHAMPIGLP